MVFDRFVVGKRGQLSVEFILIVLVVLVLIETIILPLRDYSESSVKDVIAVSYLEEDISKIQSAINSLSAYSEGKLLVNVHVPEDSNFWILKTVLKDLNLRYEFAYSSSDMNYLNCQNNICIKEITVGKQEVSPSDTYNDTSKGFVFSGPINATLTITKLNNVITISK